VPRPQFHRTKERGAEGLATYCKGKTKDGVEVMIMA